MAPLTFGTLYTRAPRLKLFGKLYSFLNKHQIEPTLLEGKIGFRFELTDAFEEQIPIDEEFTSEIQQEKKVVKTVV